MVCCHGSNWFSHVTNNIARKNWLVLTDEAVCGGAGYVLGRNDGLYARNLPCLRGVNGHYSGVRMR